MARYTEDFNVPDGTDLGWLSEHDPDRHEGWGWTVPGNMYSTYVIQDGAVVALVAEPFGKASPHLETDHQASVDHTGTVTGVWVRARHRFPFHADFHVGYGLRLDTSSGIDLRIHRIGEGGGQVTLASTTSLAGGVTAPYRLTLRAVGDTLTAFINGHEQLSAQDATYQDGTRCGIYAGGCDNFEATDEMFSDGVDPIVAAWVSGVEAADGQALQRQVKRAVTNFVLTGKKYGSWPKFRQIGVLAGPRTLAGCAVPLLGPTPTLHRWESQHHDQFTGLQDPANPTFSFGRYISTGVAANDLVNIDNHMAIWSADNELAYDNNVGLIGYNTAALSQVGKFRFANGTMFFRNMGASYPTVAAPHDESLFGTTRSSLGSFSYLHPSLSSQTSYSETAGNPPAEEIKLFTRDFEHYWRGRVAFWSLGGSLSLTWLRARVQDYLTELVTPLRAAAGATQAESIHRAQRRVW